MSNLIFGTAGIMIGLICIRKDKGKRESWWMKDLYINNWLLKLLNSYFKWKNIKR
jgi:hypothetical protein